MASFIFLLFVFFSGAFVGGLVVYKNIDLVVQERYRVHRRHKRHNDDDRR